MKLYGHENSHPLELRAHPLRSKLLVGGLGIVVVLILVLVVVLILVLLVVSILVLVLVLILVLVLVLVVILILVLVSVLVLVLVLVLVSKCYSQVSTTIYIYRERDILSPRPSRGVEHHRLQRGDVAVFSMYIMIL